MSQTIGFVGIGAMGSAIASRLVDTNTLWVNDLNPALATPLEERGARFAPLDEIATCDVVFLSLPGPDNVLKLLLGDGGLAEKMDPGSLVIDTTSSTPIVDEGLVRDLAVKSISYIDAPIAGGVRRAYDGLATLMVGATDEDFARAEPLLNTITSNVFHLGPVGAGHAAKLVNNLLNHCNRFATVEMITLAERYGIAPDVMVDVLNVSSGRSYVTDYTYPEIVFPNLKQGFTLELMRKDAHLAEALADHVGQKLRVGSLVAEMMDEAVERLGGSADQTDLMQKWYPSVTD
ncbi:NAD(P)-dependent oxidoreductase [Rhodococcus sp. 15-725-2-2b]|uniref:NAD(P)-dependent oxidoreductase n=1 Tax=Nocardiaceae TaxID=85025 RepID=UPI00055E7806|nr:MULTISPECIES: NAD(P)-dependent oxidoreductase [Rhodococcus]OZC61937.1 NAD(P)-dependent oxidoreductase [Rhodococcus sp. 06-470-2]OZC64565.1 NAD(P)-dependent oxidoreductase [Rhodococcus sp. 06-469-3-2]OZC88000.1 NAD(P)-dependent oxidoreductase [Rhodococcus sp. 06-418-1B]OZD51199.1 NAD(P)-dependent oxidoreductase [Rhodococcus sp. 06-1477-1A]OZE32105.1 NAD(P)-dependent oxidoreductase [Rhodococcus sp. 05-2254-5]